MLADGPRGAAADPAVPANCLPISYWAQAIWHRWFPKENSERTVRHAAAALARSKRPWAVVKGPSAAYIATAQRIGWIVHSASVVTTDLGRTLHLDIDPPVVVAREAKAATYRWRLARIQERLPWLGDPETLTIFIEPTIKVINDVRDSAQWCGAYRGALRSALLNRQWPQARCHSAGWTQHDKCLLCLQRYQSSIGERFQSQPESPPPPCVPAGTLAHRVCECPSFEVERAKLWPKCNVNGEIPQISSYDQLSRGIFTLPVGFFGAPTAEATFVWVKRPENGTAKGTFYTDGSRLDGSSALTARLGWSFAVLGAGGETVAVARGLPPVWVTDIPGAEAWALYQAGTVAEPGSVFRCDCKPCVDAFHNGREWACAANRPLARVFRLVHTALDDVRPDDVVWMPAHTKHAEVGVRELGNGTVLTERDRRGNEIADVHAKAAVAAHRVPRERVEAFRLHCEAAQRAARWLGRVTWLASNQPAPCTRDSIASRATALKRAAVGRRTTKRRFGEVTGACRGAAQGGHELIREGARWRCVSCRVAGQWSTLAQQKCSGEVAMKWAKRAQETIRASGAATDQVVSHGHKRMRSGTIIWCNVCGAYGENLGDKLARRCTGIASTGGGGSGQRLDALRRGRHPKTGVFLGNAIPEPLWGAFANATSSGSGTTPPGAGGERGQDQSDGRSRLLALRQRIRAKEASGRCPGSAACFD